MGPLLVSSGMPAKTWSVDSSGKASMGPLLVSSGMITYANANESASGLQWGRCS